MKIDWAALGSVFGVSLISTVALVGLFTLGIVGLTKRETAAAQGAPRRSRSRARTRASPRVRRRWRTGSI